MAETAPGIQQLVRDAAGRLEALPHANARLETEVLLAAALDKPRTYLFAWPEKQPPAQQVRAFEQAVQRRLAGEPLAYILGYREFWSMRLEVTPDTLIPRPETELLAELALGHLQGIAEARIADLGTGSGAVAAAVAQSCRRCQVFATEAAPAALDVARRNFRRLGLHNIDTGSGHWCQALPPRQRFHLILSNPPYVRADDPRLKQGDLPWEPQAALKAGPDGLDALREIIPQARAHLAPAGRLLLEHGYDQGRAVRRLLQADGYRGLETHRDPAGHDRVTAAQAPA